MHGEVRAPQDSKAERTRVLGHFSTLVSSPTVIAIAVLPRILGL